VSNDPYNHVGPSGHTKVKTGAPAPAKSGFKLPSMASKSSASSNQSPKVSYPVPTIYKPQIKSNQNSQTPTNANKPSFPLPRTHSERMEFLTPNSPSNPFINSAGFYGSSQKTMAERQFEIIEQARKVTCSEDNERVNNREIVRTNDFQKAGMYGNIAFGSMTAAAGAKAAMGAKMAAGAAYGFSFGAGILVGVIVKSVEYRHGELVKDSGVYVEGTANPPDYGGANTVYHRYNEWGELISKTFYDETGMAYYTMVMPLTVTTTDSGIGNVVEFKLPAWNKVKVDMQHIISGHTDGGGRGNGGKDQWPKGMSEAAILKAIEEAYKNAEKAGGQQVSWKDGVEQVMQFFHGVWQGIDIEFWFNHTTKTIRSTWPKWRY